jgi:hypothetical protein
MPPPQAPCEHEPIPSVSRITGTGESTPNAGTTAEIVTFTVAVATPP